MKQVPERQIEPPLDWQEEPEEDIYDEWGMLKDGPVFKDDFPLRGIRL